MRIRSVVRESCVLVGCALVSVGWAKVGVAQKPAAAAAVKGPWMNAALDPDTRADMMIKEMTLDEKIQLVHGIGWGPLRAGAYVPVEDNGGAGFVAGIPRLGLPDVN